MPMRLPSTCADFFLQTELHKYLYNSALPEKPKSDRAAVLAAATFLGWLMLCFKVLNLLTLCEDIE